MCATLLVSIAAAVAVLVSSCQASDQIVSEDLQKIERIDALYRKYQRKFPEVDGISAVELIRQLEDGGDLVLVDVRQPEEQAVSMIPGALTQAEFEGRMQELTGRTLVTYCTAGYRSGLYAKSLQAEGWRVVNLEGSLLAWTHAGGTLVDSRGPTRRVHVYSADWSLEASGYEPVW